MIGQTLVRSKGYKNTSFILQNTKNIYPHGGGGGGGDAAALSSWFPATPIAASVPTPSATPPSPFAAELPIFANSLPNPRPPLGDRLTNCTKVLASVISPG